MQLTDMLAQMGGLQSVARQLGVSEGEVAQGAEALLPAILGGFQKQAQGQGAGQGMGLEGLGGLLEQVLSPQATDVGPGNEVLGQIFGSKDVSRTVAQQAAQQTGLDASLLKQMLPLLAMLVGGYLSRQGGGTPATGAPAGGGGGLGDLLGGLMGGGAPAGTGAGGGGLGGLASLLDANGDGNPLDDILRMAGKAMR
jgi:hypothetical protein